ncbi:hypothetical protein PENSPDRAFT_512352 [Peniophora sp. CONT]|nr:hypothetical protein PENSPDRAFT_512352 [Peniophora sp. CONT]
MILVPTPSQRPLPLRGPKPLPPACSIHPSYPLPRPHLPPTTHPPPPHHSICRYARYRYRLGRVYRILQGCLSRGHCCSHGYRCVRRSCCSTGHLSHAICRRYPRA